MTKLVSDLTPKELDYWVAKAQGWELIKLSSKDGWMLAPDDYEGISKWFLPDDEYINGERWIKRYNYTPSTNGGQAMELVEEYEATLHITVDRLTEAKTYWAQTETGPSASSPYGYKEAICRAVIASHYGDEVPDDEA